MKTLQNKRDTFYIFLVEVPLIPDIKTQKETAASPSDTSPLLGAK